MCSRNRTSARCYRALTQLSIHKHQIGTCRPNFMAAVTLLHILDSACYQVEAHRRMHDPLQKVA